MTSRSRALFFCLFAIFVLTAGAATAQTTVEVLPPNPTTADNVILRVDFGGCGSPASVTRVGNNFRIDAGSVVPVCTANPVDLPLGALSAGAYTYELFFLGDQTPAVSGAFVVNAVLTDTPALS